MKKNLTDGKSFVFVFYNVSGNRSLQQVVPLQKDEEGYFAILEASNSAVSIKGVANVDIPSDIQDKINDRSLVIGDLANIYAAYTLTNDVLKNRDGALLPKSSGRLFLSTIDAAQASAKVLEFAFDYARVDVLLPQNGEEAPKLMEVYAINAPSLKLQLRQTLGFTAKMLLFKRAVSLMQIIIVRYRSCLRWAGSTPIR